MEGAGATRLELPDRLGEEVAGARAGLGDEAAFPHPPRRRVGPALCTRRIRDFVPLWLPPLACEPVGLEMRRLSWNVDERDKDDFRVLGASTTSGSCTRQNTQHTHHY